MAEPEHISSILFRVLLELEKHLGIDKEMQIEKDKTKDKANNPSPA